MPGVARKDTDIAGGVAIEGSGNVNANLILKDQILITLENFLCCTKKRLKIWYQKI